MASTSANTSSTAPKPPQQQQLTNQELNKNARFGKSTRNSFRPRGVEHDWDLRVCTPDDLRNRTQQLKHRLQEFFDIAASAGTLSFDTFLKPLFEAQRYNIQMGAYITLPRHVSDDSTLRQASAEATKVIDDFAVDLSMRKDIFDKLVEYQTKLNDTNNDEKLDAEYVRCINKMIQVGKRNGLHLNEETQARIRTIKKRLNEIIVQFSKNINDDDTTLQLHGNELSGLPPEFLEELEVDAQTGKYIITMRHGHIIPISRKCIIPGVRKLVETVHSKRCMASNSTLLDEILTLRQTEAALLGYPNHAAYVQEHLMAKNPDNVKRFLYELLPQLQALWKKEEKAMLYLKEQECAHLGFENNNKIDLWDFRYYASKIEESVFEVRQEEIMEYFPLYAVTQSIIKIYGELLGLKFTSLSHASKWHDDVQVYQVADITTKEIMGYIYLDLLSRPGKFGHACCVPIQPGCTGPSGLKQCAVSVMITNFGSSSRRPILLDHKDVETYFHEFGHLMHYICSRTKTAMYFGTRVETDFLETPSQMLENWVWEKVPLKQLSRHYVTKRPLSDELISKLVNSRAAIAGGFNLRQVVLAIVDQCLHTNPQMESKAIYAKVLKDVMGLDAIPDTNVCATFTHLCIGYSARYYSYLWSEVFSCDLFVSMFKQYGLDNIYIGQKYRQDILEPGGSKDGMDMIKKFLGRAPNNKAFLASKAPEITYIYPQVVPHPVIYVPRPQFPPYFGNPGYYPGAGPSSHWQ